MILLLSKKNLKFLVNFNLLLLKSSRFMRLCDVSKLFRGRRPKIHFEISFDRVAMDQS